jgi:hypothetical protein
MFKDKQDALVYGSGMLGISLAFVGAMSVVWGPSASEIPFGVKLLITGLILAFVAPILGFIWNQR